jgi:hypothetical protein
MTPTIFSQKQRPSNLLVPDDIVIVPPIHDLPEEIKRFFGKSGMWWGTWKSPQTKDGFETIMIITSIRNDLCADVVYIVPDYPPWYVVAGRHTTQAQFVRKENGKVSLLFPFHPFGYTMECRFEGKVLRGAVHRRFMSAYVELKPFDP